MTSARKQIGDFFKTRKQKEIDNLILDKNTDRLFNKLVEAVKNNDTSTAAVILKSQLLQASEDYKTGLAYLVATASVDAQTKMVQKFVDYGVIKDEEIAGVNRALQIGEKLKTLKL